MVEVLTPQGMEEMELNLQGHVRATSCRKKTKKRTRARCPRRSSCSTEEEANKLIDMDARHQGGASAASSSPASSSSTRSTRSPAARASHGPDVSREGVQRDLLPIVEGSTVNTKYGMVRTDHILFIAAGAFHISKPSDLIPELQGRFPIRVELDALTQDDFVRILTEPKNALIKQYVALLATEGVQLEFTDDAVDEIAAHRRRRSTSAPRTSARAACTPSRAAARRALVRRAGAARRTRWRSTPPTCASDSSAILEDEDLSRYIL